MNDPQKTTNSGISHSHDEPIDEGGLHAPPELHGWRKFWWWFHFVILVKLARLRFIAVLIVIGLVITQWDTLVAYYDRWTRPTSSTAVASDVEYFCPMHPSVVRENSKDKCPICFMPLSKRKKGDIQEEVLPAGVVNRVQLSPYRVALAGVGTWPLDYVPLNKEINAIGYVEFDERGERNVSARVAGRIDKLFVSETGKRVKTGDPLAAVYSPDLVVSVQSLLEARRSNNRSLEQSTLRKLELLGIGIEQLETMISQGSANTQITIRSPIGGHVIKKYVREGEYIQEGSPLYDIVDLSTVWIQAQIYEDDLQFLPTDLIHPEQPTPESELQVIATSRSLPNEVFKGRLAFVYPHVDSNTRTATVRFEVKNPEHKLRPGSTATLSLRIPIERLGNLAASVEGDAQGLTNLKENKILAVPESSVIDTGSQKIVYRQTVPGVFEGVRVTLGSKLTGPDGMSFYPVLDGLKLGERIITTGSFLVDAETRLNPAAGSIYFGGSSGSKAGGVATVRPSTPEDEDAKIVAALAGLSPDDQRAAKTQRYCPILTDNLLGSMGIPVKVMIEGEPVFLCCDGCKKQALAKPQQTQTKVAEAKARALGSAEKKPSQAGEPTTSNPPPSDSKKLTAAEEAEIRLELSKLPEAERMIAETQRLCPVMKDSRLGSMGKPVKIMIDGQAVYLCCEGCEDEARKNPQDVLNKVKHFRQQTNEKTTEPKSSSNASPEKAITEKESAEEREIAEALAKLSPADQQLAKSQRFCVVLSNNRLGSMGVPVKIEVAGKTMFLCCAGCKSKALADPQRTLATWKQLLAKHGSEKDK